MCGIAGIYQFNDNPPDLPRVERMTKKLAPRGPDGMAVLTRDRVALGHRQLKVPDLTETTRQPMSDPELGLDLVFDGCIYNCKELRTELSALGYHFFSDTDTEVVLNALHAWGKECVEKFNGLFAFAAYDKATERLILAHDRLGIKPLYIAETETGVSFASTLPALLQNRDIDTSIDPVALNFYKSSQSLVPAPHSLLAGVRKLPPACVRTYNKDGRRDTWNYCNLKGGDDSANLQWNEAEWREQLLGSLRNSVQRRLVADVPVGVTQFRCPPRPCWKTCPPQ